MLAIFGTVWNLVLLIIGFGVFALGFYVIKGNYSLSCQQAMQNHFLHKIAGFMFIGPAMILGGFLIMNFSFSQLVHFYLSIDIGLFNFVETEETKFFYMIGTLIYLSWFMRLKDIPKMDRVLYMVLGVCVFVVLGIDIVETRQEFRWSQFYMEGNGMEYGNTLMEEFSMESFLGPLLIPIISFVVIFVPSLVTALPFGFFINFCLTFDFRLLIAAMVFWIPAVIASPWLTMNTISF